MITSIRVGELDRSITIQTPSTTNHAVTNEEVITYSTLATVWAKRLGPKSNESIEASQQVAVNEARYFIRHRSDLNEKMLVVDGSSTYKIKGIEEMDRKSAIILTVEKRDNE